MTNLNGAGLTGLLKDDAAHDLMVSPTNCDRLTMRFKPLKSPGFS
jgi:hypothetical protein